MGQPLVLNAPHNLIDRLQTCVIDTTFYLELQPSFSHHLYGVF